MVQNPPLPEGEVAEEAPLDTQESPGGEAEATPTNVWAQYGTANGASSSRDDDATGRTSRGGRRSGRRSSGLSSSISRSLSLLIRPSQRNAVVEEVEAQAVDAEAVVYASDVKKDAFKRNLAVGILFTIIVCSLIFGLVFGLRTEEPVEIACEFTDERCCVPNDEMPLPNAILMCYCFNTTEGIFDSFTEKNRELYEAMKASMIAAGSLDPSVALDPNGCHPNNQLLLAGAQYERWGFDIGTFINAPQYSRDGVFALSYFFIVMDGVNWHQSEEWFQNSNLCSWYGTGCTFVDMHNRLALPQNNLKGTVPSALGRLSSLRLLDLSGNPNIGGNIPSSELLRMSSLSSVDLSGTEMEGTIPPSLGSLEVLRGLSLKNNKLEGMIPSELFQMTNLWVLELSGNHLEETIPTEIGLSTSLNALLLDGNSLVGSLPSQMVNLTDLEMLNIGFNSFEGTIPDFLGQLPRLEFINIFESGLVGTIPESFCGSTQTRHIIVNCSVVEECSCCSTNRETNPLVSVFCGEDMPRQTFDF